MLCTPLILLCACNSVAYAATCASRLADLDEATSTIIWDMMALHNPTVATVHDFATVPDKKASRLRTIDNAATRKAKSDPREMHVARGYAAYLKRLKTNRGVLHGGAQGFWSTPATGVIYDLTSGLALETFAVKIDRMAKFRRPQSWTNPAADLRHRLREALLGREKEDPYYTGEAPAWALIKDDALADTHLFRAVMKYDNIAARDGRLYLDRLRAKPDYEGQLLELLKHKRLVNRLEAENTYRGRLIFDMVSYGYGPEWMDSPELNTLLEELAPQTTGHYNLTLFWNSKRLIDVTHGQVTKVGYFEPVKGR